ncbi:hypothetical protein CB1_001402023 [Camelus ferus]|nr:hypothetical protein CB1_001402023 [Camelus ferus]
MAGQESSGPPLSLTRHVDAKKDALGRGELGFRSPGLPEDQQKLGSSQFVRKSSIDICLKQTQDGFLIYRL